MDEKLVEKLEKDYCSFVIEGGFMSSYDNLIVFLDNKAKKVLCTEEKFPVNVNKKSPMYQREGLYNNVYHLRGCTINVNRHFERGNGKMKVEIYGDEAGKILDNLSKLMDVEI